MTNFLLYCYDTCTNMYKLKFYPGTIVLTALILSIAAPITMEAHFVGESEKMLITAYYTPLPDQEKYYLGSYEEDVRFNGNGVSADGTPTYPGMIAAPKEIPFGTRIEISELGIVGTVHDRGGRINATEGNTMHIDIWLGEGEEGLARALEWGSRIMTTKVYPPPPDYIPSENFDLALFNAPEEAFDRMPSNPEVLIDSSDIEKGDRNMEVAAIQHALKKLEYFDHDITSFFGDVTQNAIEEFQRDAQIVSRGESADEETRNAIVAHNKLMEELDEPLPGEETFLQGTTGKDIRVLQRVLKLLSLYDGEINGMYDQETMSVVYAFQKERDIVKSLADPNAGIVGEKTHRALLTAWRVYRIQKRGGADALVAAL